MNSNNLKSSANPEVLKRNGAEQPKLPPGHGSIGVTFGSLPFSRTQVFFIILCVSIVEISAL